jgi:hypothetical protein
MTIDGLKKAIAQTSFFSNLGTHKGDEHSVALSSLSPWGGEALASVEDSRIAEELEWLPSGPLDKDPFYGDELDAMLIARDLKNAAQATRKDLRFLILQCTSGKCVPQLQCGPHNFKPAARKTAVESFARAATEAILGIDKAWCYIARLYCEGRWPCGVRNGRVVVL